VCDRSGVAGLKRQGGLGGGHDPKPKGQGVVVEKFQGLIGRKWKNVLQAPGKRARKGCAAKGFLLVVDVGRSTD